MPTTHNFHPKARLPDLSSSGPSVSLYKDTVSCARRSSSFPGSDVPSPLPGGFLKGLAWVQHPGNSKCLLSTSQELGAGGCGHWGFPR